MQETKILSGAEYSRSERLEFDMSLDGSFDSDSNKNMARKGMPDLDYLFEAGPRPQMTLTNHFRGGKVDLELPLRAVISTDFSSASYEGVVFHPQLAWQHENLYGTGTRFKISSGPVLPPRDLWISYSRCQQNMQLNDAHMTRKTDTSAWKCVFRQ